MYFCQIIPIFKKCEEFLKKNFDEIMKKMLMKCGKNYVHEDILDQNKLSSKNTL